MAVRPCANFVDCPGTDFPITNYSAEGPEDPPIYYGLVFPIDGGNLEPGCAGFGLSTSQADANLSALASLALCPSDGPDDPNECGDGSDVPNQPQSCTATCANGSVYHYTIPAGTVSAPCQNAADAQAAAMACEDAEETPCCLGNIDNKVCLGLAYSSTITATGGTSILYEVESGALPDGLTLSADGEISGTPTVAGEHTFTIKASLANGNYTTRDYTITVYSIVTGALDAGAVGAAYSAILTGIGGGSWSRASGTLPPGLTLSSGGIISGTPTTAGTYNFTVRYASQCDKALSITVGAGYYAYYKLDEASPADTLVDQVAARNLAIDATGGVSVAGKIGTALRLGVVNQQWTNAASADWVMSGSFSIRFWIKPLSDAIQAVLLQSAGIPDQWTITKYGSYNVPGDAVLGFYVDLVGGFAEVFTPALTLGAWNHVVFWYEAGVGVGCKVDNGTASTGAGVEAISTPATANLYLGATHFWGANAIDEIAIWNRKISAAEITADYNGGAGRTY